MTEVARVLAASFASHLLYQREAQQGRLTPARRQVLLQRAYDERSRAHALDPEHTDPAWGQDQIRTMPSVDTHAVLMAFYRSKGCDG